MAGAGKKMNGRNKETKLIFLAVALLFGAFLVVPVARLLAKSFLGDSGITTAFYKEVFGSRGFITAMGNSFLIAGTSALVTTFLAFLMAYTVHYTNVNKYFKKLIEAVAVLPMLLPTITYGFAIIYSFGREGLLTKLLGKQLFSIYGFKGLLLGYVIYTLPVSFVLLSNAMAYIDKKFMTVSRLMGDKAFATFRMTVMRPLMGTLAASFVQAFFLSFTDFGIPAAVGGEFEVIASVLYDQMLGSVPDFNNGAVVAMVMLIPSVISIGVLKYLEKYNVRYNKISQEDLKKSPVRDVVFGILSVAICICVLSVFAVIFVIPFVEEWPYEIHFTLENIRNVLRDKELSNVYLNSLYVAFYTAVFGTLLVYGSALVTARSKVSRRFKQIIDGIAMVTNTIPGMVLGLAFLFCFSGTGIQNTFLIMVICNMIHFFSTPYLMMKESLAKMNASWETTAMLMGDSWIKTILRVVTPNAISTIIRVFSYYFINAMVTISAVIFLAGARTMVITTKIKQLQYYNKYNEIFVLSLLLLFTNIAAKALFGYLASRKSKTAEYSLKKAGNVQLVSSGIRTAKRIIAVAVAAILVISAVSLGTGGRNSDLVVIYSNGDDEAVEAMKESLDANGYRGKYIMQTFGTSELGGKLLAEGKNLEADLITMSTFYIDSAQEQNQMFKDLTFPVNTTEEFPSYCAPVTAQEGALIINTKVMESSGLPVPESIKDLADPVYKDMISVTDVSSSSTAWLLLQALIDAYGENEAKELLTRIYENAGPHIEDSGSGPLKKVRAGEVAIGFGLRHQAVADKKAGLPVDYIDPAEGNFSLTESVAVLDKGSKRDKTAMEMAQCIIENGREKLQETYPNALYKDEVTDPENASANPEVFNQKLTVELLEKHQKLSEECKK